MLWGQIVTSCIAYYLNAYYTGKILDYSIFEQMRDLTPYLIASFIMGAFVYLFEKSVDINFSMLLFFQIIMGIVFYFIICSIMRLEHFVEVRNMFYKKIRSFC